MNQNHALIFAASLFTAVFLSGCAAGKNPFPSDTGGLRIGWSNNLLRVSGDALPGGPLEIWYLEAFCRSGSTHRDWRQTLVPHQTELLAADPDGRRLLLRTQVGPDVEVIHQIRSGKDEVEFLLSATNRGLEPADVQWFQPCIRVGGFTGATQADYWERCFIFTDRGQTMLGETRRSEEALYRGGQVYVPPGIDLADVNPRPISPDRPVNGLIGCISADGERLLATAWNQTQELFQGVIVCIHSDPRIGGLQPGQTKSLRGKLYLMENDPEQLLKRYHRDFSTPPIPKP